jgi:TolA-binding protein
MRFGDPTRARHLLGSILDFRTREKVSAWENGVSPKLGLLPKLMDDAVFPKESKRLPIGLKSRSYQPLGTITLMLVVSSFPAAQVRTDHPDPNAGALQEIASQLRQMRQSLESLRTQVLSLRVQVQEQRGAQAASRLEAIRSRLTQLQPEQAAAGKRIRFLQDAIANTRPPFARRRRRPTHGGDGPIGPACAQESRLHGQENEADASLRKEQAIENDLGRQFAEAEQAFGSSGRVLPQ